MLLLNNMSSEVVRKETHEGHQSLIFRLLRKYHRQKLRTFYMIEKIQTKCLGMNTRYLFQKNFVFHCIKRLLEVYQNHASMPLIHLC